MYCPGNLPYLTWDFTDGARGLVILIVIVIIRWPGPLRHGHYLYLAVCDDIKSLGVTGLSIVGA